MSLKVLAWEEQREEEEEEEEEEDWTSSAEHFQSSFSNLIGGEAVRGGACSLLNQWAVRMSRGVFRL